MLPINKGFNQVIPRSMQNSGQDLDEGFGDISTAADLTSVAGGSMDQAEGGKGLGALRGMTVKGEQEKAKRIGKYYEPTNYTTVKH